MIALVAITHAAAPPPPEGLRALPAGSLAAVVGPVHDAEEVTAEMLWRHEQAVEELMADRDVLPVRFGTRFAREEDATEEVAARGSTYAAALERVRGAVELSVRAIAVDPVAVHDALRVLARDARTRPVKGGGEVLRAAYLVDRDAVDGFVARVAELQSAQAGAQLLCTGPWPPYSFSEER